MPLIPLPVVVVDICAADVVVHALGPVVRVHVGLPDVGVNILLLDVVINIVVELDQTVISFKLAYQVYWNKIVLLLLPSVYTSRQRQMNK